MRHVAIEQGLKPAGKAATPEEGSSRLPPQQADLVSQSDTFFIATYTDIAEDGVQLGAIGCDISHRGGAPGFVQLEQSSSGMGSPAFLTHLRVLLPHPLLQLPWWSNTDMHTDEYSRASYGLLALWHVSLSWLGKADRDRLAVVSKFVTHDVCQGWWPSLSLSACLRIGPLIDNCGIGPVQAPASRGLTTSATTSSTRLATSWPMARQP